MHLDESKDSNCPNVLSCLVLFSVDSNVWCRFCHLDLFDSNSCQLHAPLVVGCTARLELDRVLLVAVDIAVEPEVVVVAVAGIAAAVELAAVVGIAAAVELGAVAGIAVVVVEAVGIVDSGPMEHSNLVEVGIVHLAPAADIAAAVDLDAFAVGDCSVVVGLHRHLDHHAVDTPDLDAPVAAVDIRLVGGIVGLVGLDSVLVAYLDVVAAEKKTENLDKSNAIKDGNLLIYTYRPLCD